MTMFPQLTHVVAVPLSGERHLVDHKSLTLTLCGLPVSEDLLRHRSGAGRLPLCTPCDAEDKRRCPDRYLRIIDR